MTLSVVDSAAGFAGAAATTTTRHPRPLHRTLGACFDPSPSHLRPPGSFPTANDDGSFPANHVVGLMTSAGHPLAHLEEGSQRPRFRPTSFEPPTVDPPQGTRAIPRPHAATILPSVMLPRRDEDDVVQPRSYLTLLLCRSRRQEEEIPMYRPLAAISPRSPMPHASIAHGSAAATRTATRAPLVKAAPPAAHPRMGRVTEGRRPGSIGHATQETERSSSSNSDDGDSCSSASSSGSSLGRIPRADRRSSEYSRWPEPGAARHANYHPLWNDEELLDTEGGWDNDQQPLLSGLEVNVIKRWQMPLSAAAHRRPRQNVPTTAIDPMELSRITTQVATPSSTRQ